MVMFGLVCSGVRDVSHVPQSGNVSDKRQCHPIVLHSVRELWLATISGAHQIWFPRYLSLRPKKRYSERLLLFVLCLTPLCSLATTVKETK